MLNKFDQIPESLLTIQLFYTVKKVETQIQETEWFMTKLDNNWCRLYHEMKQRIKELEITRNQLIQELKKLGVEYV